MADIFGKDQKYAATNILTADIMRLKVGDLATGAEYLVQNVQIQYNQPINRIFEIGSSNVYFAPGRSVGSLQIGRIIGKESLVAVLGPVGTGVWTTNVEQGDAASRTLTFANTAPPGEGGALGGFEDAIAWIISGGVVESYGLGADANGLLVQENVQIQFAGLEFK